MRSFCFEIIYGILLIVQKGHSTPDGQRVALNVRPLQPKRFFLAKPAVQTEGAEYAGAWFYDYTHQNIDLIGKQSLFLFRFSVRGDFDTLSRIINNQMIQTCFLKNLAHSQKNFTLQAFRSGCNAGHNLSDVNWFYVSEFHVSDLFHDVEIIAIPVHFDGTVLALDPQTGDLCFDANGMLMLREDAEAIAQNVRNNLLTWKGEFPLNTDHGTDWERVVQQPRSEAVDEVDSVVRSSIFQEPYVQEISSLSMTADGRALGVEFSGVLYNGETIRVEVNTGG